MQNGGTTTVDLVTLVVSILNGGGLFYLGAKLGQLDAFRENTTKTLDNLPCQHNHVCRIPER